MKKSNLNLEILNWCCHLCYSPMFLQISYALFLMKRFILI